MATVIPIENLSTEIIVNQFRDPMRNAVGGDAAAEITDPNYAARDRLNSNQYMIVTAHPDTDPIYPLVVVREAGDSGSRPDRRVGLHEHEYDVAIEILAASATTFFDLRDSIRAWFEHRIETLNANGFEDPESGPFNRTNWESDPKVIAGEGVFSGTVNTD